MPAQRPLFGGMRPTWSSARALMSWSHWRGSRPLPPPPLSCTNWTRLVLLPVLTGHVSRCCRVPETVPLLPPSHASRGAPRPAPPREEIRHSVG